MVGDNNGCFRPDAGLTRAELAQVFCTLYRTDLSFALEQLTAAMPSQPGEPETPVPTLEPTPMAA